MPPLIADQQPADATTLIAGILGCLVAFAFYMAPSVIAIIRGHPNVGPIIVVNLFLGWVCIGWVIALAWCFSAGPGSQQVIVNQGRDDDDYDRPRRRRRRDDYDD